MKKPENYEELCAAFADQRQKNFAALCVTAQDRAHRLSKAPANGGLAGVLSVDLGWDEPPYDALSAVWAYTREAFIQIAKDPRIKYERDHKRMYAHRVKEMDAYSLSWLSRRPGATTKEKVAYARGKIMGVVRNLSYDTLENRLLKAFAKELNRLFSLKLNSYPKELIHPADASARATIEKFLRSDEVAQIGRWENLPPNNILLSDRLYRKIWLGWLRLKKLDEVIKNASDNFDEILSDIFYVELLKSLNVKLPAAQKPAWMKFKTLKLCDIAADAKIAEPWGAVQISRGKHGVVLLNGDKRFTIDFKNGSSVFDGDTKRQQPVTRKNFAGLVLKFINKTGLPNGADALNTPKEKPGAQEQKRHRALIADIFASPALYMDEEQEEFSVSLIGQNYTVNGKTYELDCGAAKAVEHVNGATEEFTVHSAILDGDDKTPVKLRRLMRSFKNAADSRDVTYIIPDGSDELTVGALHGAVCAAYGQARPVPASVAAAFATSGESGFFADAGQGDYLLSAVLHGRELTLTLAGAAYEQTDDGEEVRIWERRPARAVDLGVEVKNAFIKPYKHAGLSEPDHLYRLFGAAALAQGDGIPLIFYEGRPFTPTPELKEAANAKIDVTKHIDNFIAENRKSGVIGKDAEVRVALCRGNLTYGGDFKSVEVDSKALLYGCGELRRQEKLLNRELWFDYLPPLAIKRLIGKFDIFEGEDGRVAFTPGKPQDIKVNGVYFTLPAGFNEYFFNLIRQDGDKNRNYKIKLNHPSFPLERPADCTLELKYNYAAEYPYELKFKFLDKNGLEVETKAEWSRLKKGYLDERFKAPPFRKGKSWNALSKEGVTRDLKDVFDGKTLRNENVYDLRNAKVINEKYFEFVTKDGKKALVQFLNDEHKRLAKSSKIQFRIEPRRREIELDLNQIKNKKWCRYYWLLEDVEFKGELIKIKLFGTNFIEPIDTLKLWCVGPVRFAVSKKNAKHEAYMAWDIQDLKSGDEPPIYIAQNVKSVKDVGEKEEAEGAAWRLHWRIRNAGRRISEPDAPQELKHAFANFSDSIINNYLDIIKKIDAGQKVNIKQLKYIFTVASLYATDIGKKYYNIAENFFENIQKYYYPSPLNRNYEKPKNVLPKIGDALGDFTKDEQRALWEVIRQNLKRLKKMKFAIPALLAGALWNDKCFVENFYEYDKGLTGEYLKSAVDYICKHAKEGKKLDSRLVGCIEFVLGLLRLREYGKDESERAKLRMRLSLGDPDMDKLYVALEKLAEAAQERTKTNSPTRDPYKSFLNIGIPDKGEYTDVPDILYAALRYVSGLTDAGDITISVDDADPEA